MTTEQALKMGFKPLGHFTIGNSLHYQLKRNIILSHCSADSANEMLSILQIDLHDPKKIEDVIIIHNYDYDGPLKEDFVKNLIKIFKK